MTEPNLFFVDCADAQGGHRMAYWQWGDPHSPHVVLCVHGLTRQGRDFDVLAQAIVARAGGNVRVVCPDVVGRGQSDWLVDPNGYQIPLYAADMLALLARLNAEHAVASLDHVGTSMGGLIGLVLAGNANLPLPAPIRRLVLNDVGPTINAEALQRIGLYLGQVGRFASLQQAADAMWSISQSFGPHTPDEWLALSHAMVVPSAWRSEDGTAKRPGDVVDGPFVLHYDPAIAVPFHAITSEAAAQGEAVLWSLYDAVPARVLITRGAESDLLSRDTALAMTERGPQARLVEFEGVGHAPTFVKPDQVATVTSFLFD
jgi:pimeloyl-ACP methyl ester carboxylesterase